MCSGFVNASNPRRILLVGEVGYRSTDPVAGVQYGLRTHSRPVFLGLPVARAELLACAQVLGAVAVVLRGDRMSAAVLGKGR